MGIYVYFLLQIPRNSRWMLILRDMYRYLLIQWFKHDLGVEFNLNFLGNVMSFCFMLFIPAFINIRFFHCKAAAFPFAEYTISYDKIT